MAQFEKEINAFNSIKYRLLSEKVDNISFDEFERDRVFYSCYDARHMFAMSQQDMQLIENAFFKANPNPDLSKFPDFIYDNGFIEHFEITSSETTSCGSLHKKEYSRFERKVKADVKALEQEMNQQPSFGEIKSVSNSFVDRNRHSHEYILESLNVSLNKHIDSLKKYTGPTKTKIFLIEYTECMLQMHVDYPDILPERHYGELIDFKSYEYMFSRDLEALKRIYKQKEYVDYIIFLTDYNYEIIGVRDIPELIKLQPFAYEIHPVFLNILDSTFGMSIPCGDSNTNK